MSDNLKVHMRKWWVVESLVWTVGVGLSFCVSVFLTGTTSMVMVMEMSRKTIDHGEILIQTYFNLIQNVTLAVLERREKNIMNQ